jgi:hypothetical protein
VRGRIVEPTVRLGFLDTHTRRDAVMANNHDCANEFARDGIGWPLKEFPL